MSWLSRRVISFGFALVLLGGLWGGEASPAMAAGGTFYVGACHKGGYSDIPSAVSAAGGMPSTMKKTIVICKGTQLVSSVINIMVDNLRITGKHGAVITTPASYNSQVFYVTNSAQFSIRGLTMKPGASFGGIMVYITNSANVRVQGLVLDGQGQTNGGYGIELLNSGGSIVGNKILNWHSPTYSVSGTTVFVAGSGVETMRVSGNRIDGYQGNAISLYSLASVSVTGNRISGTYANPGPVALSGIVLAGVQGGRVSGNRITGGASLAIPNITMGIGISWASNLKVSGNRLTNWDYGIDLYASCTAPINTSNNRVTGNQMKGVYVGIDIYSVANSTCDSHADNNIVKGNKVRNTGPLVGLYGVWVRTGDNGSHHGNILNATITGNSLTHTGTAITSPLPNPPYVTGVFGPNKVHP